MRLTDLVSTAFELLGLAAVVYGVALFCTPAAFMTGGVFAVLAGLGLDRVARRQA